MWSHSIVPDVIRLVHLFQELIETAQLTQLCIFNLNIPLLLGCLCTKIVSKIETSAQNTKTSELVYFAHFLAWISAAWPGAHWLGASARDGNS